MEQASQGSVWGRTFWDQLCGHWLFLTELHLIKNSAAFPSSLCVDCWGARHGYLLAYCLLKVIVCLAQPHSI